MLYFAYGSLMDYDFVVERFPNTEPWGRAALPGHRLQFSIPSIDFFGGNCADIVPDAQATVWGVIYETTEADLALIDDFECVKEGEYQRVKVDIRLDGQMIVLATAYHACQGGGQQMAPTCEYLGLMLRGARAHSLPTEYINSLIDLASRLPKQQNHALPE